MIILRKIKTETLKETASDIAEQFSELVNDIFSIDECLTAFRKNCNLFLLLVILPKNMKKY